MKPLAVFGLLLLLALPLEALRVATYNVRNYLVMDRQVDGKWRPDWPKPEAEKAVLRAIIADADADILVLQEMGGKDFVEELRRDLAAEGLAYPYFHVSTGLDRSRQLAVLSRVKPVEVRRADAGRTFEYLGRRTQMRRGLLETVYEVEDVRFSVFTLHLKSKLTTREEDPESAVLRLKEAQTVAAVLTQVQKKEDGAARYLVLGDFNDEPGTPPLRALTEVEEPFDLGRVLPATDPDGESWTAYWRRGDLHRRVDLVFASPAMQAFVVDGRAHISGHADSLAASDHRLVWVDLDFEAAAGGEPTAP